MTTVSSYYLTPEQSEVAAKLGISPATFAQHLNAYFEETKVEYDTEDVEDYNPNNDPIYTAPIENVRGMWIARFGDRWVEDYEVTKDEDEWANIVSRLKEYDMLEEDLSGNWIKIKEERK